MLRVGKLRPNVLRESSVFDKPPSEARKVSPLSIAFLCFVSNLTRNCRKASTKTTLVLLGIYLIKGTRHLLERKY